MSVAVIRAIQVAEFWHRGQVRKYTGEPYLCHLLEVGGYLAAFHAPSEVVCAGILHDVREDTKISREELVRLVGVVVADLVGEVTDEFTHDKYPGLKRALRKGRERERQAGMSWDAKAIKCADILSNTVSIGKYDVEFARNTYFPEIKTLLPLLSDSYPLLYQHTCKVFYRVAEELGVTR